MRRIVAIALMLVWGAALCTGAQGETVLSFWTVSQARADAMSASAEAWNAAYPDRTISLQASMFASDMFDEKLWTVLHSGVLAPDLIPPDIVDVEYQNIAKYVNPQNSLFYSLDGSGVSMSPATEPFFFRGMCFALPVESGEMKIVYNLEALSAADMDPATIASWSEFEAFAAEYTRRTAKPFLGIDIDHYLTFLTLYLLNTEQMEEEEAYRHTLETLAGMVKQESACLMPGGRLDSRSFREAFINGDIACAFMRVGDAEEYQDSFSVLPLPQMGDESGVWIPGYGVCVTTFCRDYILAMDFLRFACADAAEPADGMLISQNTEITQRILEDYEMELAYMIFE